MVRCLLITLFALFGEVSLAQNFIRNGSFEKHIDFVNRKGNGLNLAFGWLAPKYNSDLYTKGAGFFRAGTPHNIFGHQKPHSGNSYAGICTRTHFLEYIETVLRDTLQAGQRYLVELYIVRAELSFRSIKEFGVLFSPKKIWGLQTRGIALEPHLKFEKKHGFRNKHRWQKLSAIYTAEGGEKVFIFGHFNYNKKDDRRRINAHYFIDDVSVTLVQDQLPALDDTVVKSDFVQSTRNTRIAEVEHAPELEKVLVLEQVYFASNKATLLPPSFPELEKIIRYLKNNTSITISITGHTDDTGNESDNQILSEQRAAAVADYIEQHGIPIERIDFKGSGSRQPLSNNDNEAGRAKNRRVEVVFSQH